MRYFNTVVQYYESIFLGFPKINSNAQSKGRAEISMGFMIVLYSGFLGSLSTEGKKSHAA